MYPKQSTQAVNDVAIPMAPEEIPKGSAIVKLMNCTRDVMKVLCWGRE